MLKLSRRNWNNVLIFVVLIIMFSLYDWSGGKTVTGVTQLVPEQAQLLSVSVNNQRLVNAAGQWQLQPAGQSSVNAQQMASAWQYSILQPVSLQTQQSWVPVAQASVQLVGELMPQIWLLYPAPLEPSSATSQPQYLLQQVGQPQLYQLSAAQARLLFLVE